jgi:phosphopantetheinyl transferase (holo-ACP synthase)
MDVLAEPARRLSWLSAHERDALGGLRDRRRREAWLRGRVLAKRLILLALDAAQLVRDFSESGIDICSRNDEGRPVRPSIRIGGRPMPWGLSITHTDDVVAAVLATAPGTCVGVDAVPVAAYGDGFLETWMSSSERGWITGTRDVRTAAIVWAAKEAMYKAVNRGEPFVPRALEISPGKHARHAAPLAHVYGNGRPIELTEVGGAILALFVNPGADGQPAASRDAMPFILSAVSHGPDWRLDLHERNPPSLAWSCGELRRGRRATSNE